MPIHTIQVSEYECVHCGYKWINRVNGKDGPKPKNCAKCKRVHWNGKDEGSGYNPITPSERNLRVRLYKFEGYPDGRQYRPNALCEKFLSLNPRPTMQELYEALYPLKYDPHKTDKNSYYHLIPDHDPNRQYRPGHINLKVDNSPWIPDPKNPGRYVLNRDPNFKSDWIKLLEEETRLRRQVMIKVIKSRGEKVPKVKTFKEWQDDRKEQFTKSMANLYNDTIK
jgi:hypothetical protein